MIAGDFPATVEDAVHLLRQSMSPEQWARFAEPSAEDLVLEHVGPGQWIRNCYDLCAPHANLVRAIGMAHPADALILSALSQDFPRERLSAMDKCVAQVEGPSSTSD